MLPRQISARTMAPSTMLCRAAWRAGSRRSITAAGAAAAGGGGRSTGGLKAVAPIGQGIGCRLSLSSSTHAFGTGSSQGGAGDATKATGFGLNGLGASAG